MNLYEEKYNEILEWARKNKARLNGVPIEEVLPELRESEDERIINQLITLVNSAGEFLLIPTYKEELVAWLEKQKEQKPTEKHDPVAQLKEHLANATKEQLEAEWKELEKWNDVGPTVEEYLGGIKPAEYIKRNSKEWYSLLAEQYDKGFWKGKAEQKPAEWSEEDEDMLNSCISSIEEAKENRYAYRETDGDTSYDHEISWLKSIRPSWKPSEEQMKALSKLQERERMLRNEMIKWYKEHNEQARQSSNSL